MRLVRARAATHRLAPDTPDRRPTARREASRPGRGPIDCSRYREDGRQPESRSRQFPTRPSRGLRPARLPALDLGAAAARGAGLLADPARQSRRLLGDHEARRHHRDRQAPRPLPVRSAARDPASRGGGPRSPADADPDGSADARRLPPADQPPLHAAHAQEDPRADREDRARDRREALREGRRGELRFRERGLGAASDRGDRVAARGSGVRLADALRLDEQDPRRRRPRISDRRARTRARRPSAPRSSSSATSRSSSASVASSPKTISSRSSPRPSTRAVRSTTWKC